MVQFRLLFLVVVVLGVDQLEVPHLVHQVLVEHKEEVVTLEHLVLDLHIQEILMTHLHQVDGDVQVQLVYQQTELAVAAVALVMEVVQVLKVVMVFNFQPHLEIQMDSNMTTSQIIRLDPVELLVIL